MKSIRSGYDSNFGDDHSAISRNSSMLNTGNNLADSYNRVAQLLRDSLLKHGGDSRNHRQIVRNIFRRIDENGSGVLTDQEMKDFVKSPELDLFGNDNAHIDKFTELLVQQIDVNRDGTVSLQELEEFLFPTKSSEEAHEVGIILDLCRKALVRIIGSSGAASTGSDDAVLAEFVKLTKTQVKKSGQIEVRVARKALENLVITELGRNLLESEIEGVVHSIDANQDGIITSKDFKSWLLPQNNNNNREFLVRYLTKVVEDRFHGNVRLMHNNFKTYGMDSVSRADFITRMKALDSGLPRQFLNDLADALCGRDKTISFANMIDFLEIKNIPNSVPEGEFEGEDEEADMNMSRSNSDNEEEEEVYTIVPREDQEVPVTVKQPVPTKPTPAIYATIDDSNRNTEDIIHDIMHNIILYVEHANESQHNDGRRSLLLSMHGDAHHHYANSQNHVVDLENDEDDGNNNEDDDFPPPFLGRNNQSHLPLAEQFEGKQTNLLLSRSRSRSNSPRSERSQQETTNTMMIPTRSPSAMYSNQANNYPHLASPRSQSSLSPRNLSANNSQHYLLSSQASFDPHNSSQNGQHASPDNMLQKRSSSATLRGLSGLGGSMYMGMMDNLQHLPNSSPAGLKSGTNNNNNNSGKKLTASPDNTGRFSHSGGFSATEGTMDFLQSPVTADEIEEARRLLQETRRQRGHEKSPLAKMKEANYQRQLHQNQFDSYDEDDHNHSFHGEETAHSIPPPPPPDQSPPSSPTNPHYTHQQQQQQQGNLKKDAKNANKYGALGYTAQQLVEFGYLKHTGRWRGFPYDSWSCCNTSEVVCPLAPKINHMSAKTSKETLFIHTEKVSPTKTRQQQRQELSHSIYLDPTDEDGNDDNNGHGSSGTFARYSSQAVKKRITVKLHPEKDDNAHHKNASVKSNSQRNRHQHEHNHNKTPQPRKEAPVLTKFTMNAHDIFDNSFQKSMKTASSSSPSKSSLQGPLKQNPRDKSAVKNSPNLHQNEDDLEEEHALHIRAMRPSVRISSANQQKHHHISTHNTSTNTTVHNNKNTQPPAAAAVITQHIHHHQRVIERVIIKPAPPVSQRLLVAAAPNSSNTTSLGTNPDKLAKHVQETVKQSTEKVLSSYEKALKELKKELDTSRNQSNNRDAKVYLTVEKQQQTIDELKKSVSKNMVVLRRSIVATLEKQQKLQEKNLKEQQRLQRAATRSHSAPPRHSPSKHKDETITTAAVATAAAGDHEEKTAAEDSPRRMTHNNDASDIHDNTNYNDDNNDNDNDHTKDLTPKQDESFEAIFDGDLKQYRHLVQEVSDLKDSPMKYVVGDYPVDDIDHYLHHNNHNHHKNNHNNNVLNSTGLSEEALDMFFSDSNSHKHGATRRDSAGAQLPRNRPMAIHKNQKMVPTNHTHAAAHVRARSVSPNHRISSSSSNNNNNHNNNINSNNNNKNISNNNKEVSKVVLSSTKPWIPAATHANHLFNRIAVVNYSKGHTASNTSKSNNTNNNNNNSNYEKSRSRSASPARSSASPQLSHSHSHSHYQPPPHSSYSSSSRPGSSSSSSSRRNRNDSSNINGGSSNSRLDALLARHIVSPTTKSSRIQQNTADTTSVDWPDVSHIKLRDDSYFHDPLLLPAAVANAPHGVMDTHHQHEKLLWQYPPKISVPPTNASAIFAKMPPAATSSPLGAKEQQQQQHSSSRIIDYRLHDDNNNTAVTAAAADDDDDEKQHGHRDATDKKQQQQGTKKHKAHKRKDHHRHHHQAIPMAAILESKDEWWAKIMAEKQRREDEAYQRALSAK